MRHLRALAVVAVTALAFGTVACADESTPDPGSTGVPDEIRAGLKIAFLPKQVNNAYFDTSDNQGGKVAVEEFGGEFLQTGPTEAGASAQVNVTVPGARPGDFASAAFSLATSGLVFLAQVGATDVVTVTAWNRSGAAIDLGAGTVRARVVKA